MQQVDDVGIWKVPQEPPLEEPMRDVDEGTPSPDSPEKVDGPAALSPGGRSGAEWAPASPTGPLSADADEDLVNGEVQDGRLSGNGCSPEEAESQEAPVAGEKGDHQPHQGGSEAASATSPAGQSLGPGKAPAGRQRKLAMEEMVIRDHLGQEVGCMDAVGQSQSPLEELGGHGGLEGRRDSWSQPEPVVGVSSPNEALGEGPPGSRDGPEGESPTSQGHRSPSGVSQDENGCAKGPGDEPLEVGPLATEAGGSGGGQEAVPEQGALEVGATLALATGDAPATGSTEESQGSPGETPESLQGGAAAEGQVPTHPGSQLEQLTEPLPHQFPPVQEMQGLSSQEEVQIPLLDPALPSSPVFPQDTAPSPPGTEESLPDQIAFQENQGSLLGPELPFASSQSPSAPLEQNSSSPESKGSLLAPTPSAVQECLSGEDPPALRDPLSSPLEERPPDVQGEPPLLLPDVVHSATDQVTASLQGAERALVSWSPAPPGTQTASLMDQPTHPLPEGGPAALQGTPSPGHGMEEAATQQGREAEASLPHTLHSLTDQISSLPEQTVSLRDAEMPASEESSPRVAPQDQMPVPPELRVSPLPEADACLPSQTPPPVTAPGESPAAAQDQLPPIPQDTESSFPASEDPASSLQEADRALPDEIQAPLPSHTSPPLPEEEGLPPDQGPAAPEDQAVASLLGQAPPCQEAAKSLSEGQNSSDAPEESASGAAHTSSPDKAPGPVLQETLGCPNALPLSQETLQPLLDKSKVVEDLDAEGSGNASMASAGAATEILGNLHAERQPLLQEAKGPGDISAGDLPPEKPPAASSNPAPNDSSPRSSTNTACAPQLQAALPRQGPDPEPEKGKRKSCQCCALM